jgi:Helix-turn-helix domain
LSVSVLGRLVRVVEEMVQCARVVNDVGQCMLHKQIPPDPDALLGEVQAADFLSLSVRTLQAWRARAFGPAFVRAGRAIRYRRRDLLAWMDANTVSSARVEIALRRSAT